MILVVDRRDSMIRHDNGVLRLEREGADARRIPINTLELVVVYGNPLAETAVWRKLAAAGVPTVLLPSRGQDPAAVLGNGLATQLPLRRMQHRCAANRTASLAVARWFIARKLDGYELALKPLRERHDLNASACRLFLERRDQAREGLDGADTLDGALGLEGQVAHAWFGLLSVTLTPGWGFRGRNRRPPRDPVNALLSLGYTLAGAEVHHTVIAAGMDPSLGFLHQPVPGRESLVLDFTEIYRAAVDHFVLSWIDPAGPDQAHYYYREDIGCRLSKGARPRFFQAWAGYRTHWPYNACADSSGDWPVSTLVEQVRGAVESLRTLMKTLESSP